MLWTAAAMAAVLGVAVTAVWIGLNKRYKAPSPMRCLPNSTTVVFRLGDRGGIAERVDSSAYGGELAAVLGGDLVLPFAARIDSLFGPDVIGEPALRERDLYVSLTLRGDGGVGQFAASFALRNRMEWHRAMSALRDREAVSVGDTSVRGHGLFLLRQEGCAEPLFMAAGGGCLFASTTPDLLLGFGRDSIVTLRDDPTFSTIERTVAAGAPASVFVNTRSLRLLPDSVRPGLDGRFLATIMRAGLSTDWMALDLHPSGESLSADGFVVAPHPSLSILTARETTEAINIARRVPQGVCSFERVGPGPRGLSSASFAEFLSGDSSGAGYRAAQSDLFRRSGFDVEAMLSQVFSAELALCRYDALSPTSEFLIADTRGGTAAQSVLAQLLAAMHGGAAPMAIGEIAAGESAVPASVVSRRADAQRVSDVSFPVYTGFEPGDDLFFLPKIFGGRQVPCRLFFRYEDAIILADNMGVLRRVLADYAKGNTLDASPHYSTLRSHFGTECSHFSLRRMADGEAFDVIASQLTMAGRLPYVNIFARASATATGSRPGRAPTWQTRLDTTVRGDIYGVVNHYTRLTECLAQDCEGRLCLVGADGMLLWRRAVDGPIVGGVSQVDFYSNGKLQYLFATPNSLYIVDRLGNDVGPFPVRLPSRAQSGASRATYSDGSPMRFFVGCEGGVALFGPDGKAVDGWKPLRPEGAIEAPARHLVCSGKDFIVFRDRYSHYFTDRRGSRRLTTQPLAPGRRGEMTVGGPADSYFVTTTSDGSVVAIDGTNGNLTRLEMDSIGPDHVSMPLAGGRYLVVGRTKAAVVDIGGAAPKVASTWRTGLQSLGAVCVERGVVGILDNEAGAARLFSIADGKELKASPLPTRGTMALGVAKEGLVAFTIGESGEICQTPLR